MASRTRTARRPAQTADVPLLDPDRRICGNGVVRAHQEVRSRVVAEGMHAAVDPAAGPDVRPFPVLPVVAALHPRAEPVLRKRVRTAVGCLQLLVRRYPRDPELREFLAVPPVLDRWVTRHPRPEALTVDFCRPDLQGATLGSTRLLEFNAGSPDGVLVAGAVNRFWRESSLGPLLAEWELPPTPFEEPAWFADWLLGHARARSVPEDSPVGLLHAGTPREFRQMTAQLERRGRTVVEQRLPEGERVAGLRVAYLEHIPVHPPEVRGWDAFCARVTSGELVVPNPPAARWVAENKLCVAALSDPRFRRLFTPGERAALDALVPFSRKLGDGIGPAEAVAHRADLVLKRPYGCRGDAVVLGADTAPRDWAALVRDPARRGWLVQQRVDPAVLRTEDGPWFQDLLVPVLDGHVIGYASRVSGRHLFDASRGGSTHAVFTATATAS